MAHEPTDYVCIDCGATDRDRGTYESSPQAIVCYHCKAGAKMGISDQIMRGVGMLPLATVEHLQAAR